MPLLIVIFLCISFLFTGSFLRRWTQKKNPPLCFVSFFHNLPFFMWAWPFFGLFSTVQALTSLDLIHHIHSFFRHQFCQACPSPLGWTESTYSLSPSLIFWTTSQRLQSWLLVWAFIPYKKLLQQSFHGLPITRRHLWPQSSRPMPNHIWVSN